MYNVVLKLIIEEVIEIFIKVFVWIGIIDKYVINCVNIGYFVCIVELILNIVYSYIIIFCLDSVLFSIYGIGSIEIIVKFEYMLFEEIKFYVIFSSKFVEIYVIIKNLIWCVENYIDFIGYIWIYIYKDK